MGDHLAPSSTVHTTHGPVEGFVYCSSRDSSSKNTSAIGYPSSPQQAEIFLAIPYAAPPVGELRMERPISPPPWSSVKQCKEFSAGSVSLNPSAVEFTGEDSLTLNVFRPKIAPNGAFEGSHRPILIYMHGGGFCSGSSREYGYEQWVENFVLSQGLIFVSVQYRLGPLGFLSANSHSLPGNVGLWDQAKAIEFVHRNAEAFGGDPARITLWGVSAGAASISLLSLSPRCAPMIGSTIEISGCASAIWALNREAIVEASREFIETLLGCDALLDGGRQEGAKEQDEGAHWKNILRAATLEEIRRASFEMRTCRKQLNLLMYQPTVDGELIPDDVPALLSSASTKFPVLMGLTASEGLYFTVLGRDRYLNEFFVARQDFSSYALEEFQHFIATVVAPVKRVFANRQDAIASQKDIIAFYAGDPDLGSPDDVDDHHYLKAYTRLLSDLWFNVPTMRMARERARLGWRVYLYHNAYFNERQFPKWIPFRASTHANEYPYINGLFPVGRFDFTETDYKHRRLLNDIIGGFTRSRQPQSSPSSGLDFSGWKPVSADGTEPLRFLKIDRQSNCSVGRVKELEESLKFWETFAGKYSFDPVSGRKRTT